MVEEGCRTFPFPFEEFPAPKLQRGGVRVEGAVPRVLLTVRRTVHVPSEPDSGVLDLGWISAEANPPTVSK